MLVNATARGMLNLSRLTAQFEHLVVNGFVSGVSIGYIVLSNMLGRLDGKLLGGVVLFIASMPRYLGKVHQITQKGNLQHFLLWMVMGIGLLSWGIYWATRGV